MTVPVTVCARIMDLQPTCEFHWFVSQSCEQIVLFNLKTMVFITPNQLFSVSW